MRILNQVTETHTLIDLAKLISDLTGAKIRHYQNPRYEANENHLEVSNDHLLDLGLTPTCLSEGLLEEILDIAHVHRERIDPQRILPSAVWNKSIKLDDMGAANIGKNPSLKTASG